MSLEVDVYPPVNGNQYVVLSGRLDSNTYQQLDDVLEPLLAAAKPSMVLVMELARLEYISSAGIRSILKARKLLAPQHGKVLALHPQAQIRKVLDIVQALPVSDIFATSAELDAYLDKLQRDMLEGQ
ncbi:MAG: anti-sigma factor antagonist [Lysobacteraceae bacterium]|nr:MAG: anti-sigma factor antagonist [Xanthomonadaceae bacterium]